MCFRALDANESAELLDHAYLDNLETHLGQQTTTEILSNGLTDLSGRLDRLAELHRESSQAPLALAAHDMVGCAGQMGLSALALLARALERAVHAGRCDTSRLLVTQIAEIGPQSILALQAWISRAG